MLCYLLPALYLLHLSIVDRMDLLGVARDSGKQSTLRGKAGRSFSKQPTGTASMVTFRCRLEREPSSYEYATSAVLSVSDYIYSLNRLCSSVFTLLNSFQRIQSVLALHYNKHTYQLIPTFPLTGSLSYHCYTVLTLPYTLHTANVIIVYFV